MFAHAAGGSSLPAPPWLLSYIGVALVLGTAVVLRATWTRPRHPAVDPQTPPAPRVGPGHILGLIAFLVILGLSVAGPDSSAASFSFWFVLVVWWVGLPLLCLLLGDVFRATNPFLPVVALLDRGRAPDTERTVPTWTAGASLAVWAWYLLAYYDPSPRTVAALLVAHAAFAIVGGLRWGRDWLMIGEAFGGLSASVARIGVRGWRGKPAVATTTLLMIVLIGSTAFDGFTYLPFWQDVLSTSRGWTRTLLNTAGLVWLTTIAGGAYLLVVRVAERGQAEEHRDRRLTQALGAALVPLAVGWFLGHDLTFLLGDGQNAYALASDPLGRGWDLFGTFDHTIDYSILTEPWVPWAQLVLIAAGHVAAVVLLHELALERLSPRAAMRTTWTMAAVTSASIVGAALLVLG